MMSCGWGRDWDDDGAAATCMGLAGQREMPVHGSVAAGLNVAVMQLLHCRAMARASWTCSLWLAAGLEL
jgi:hypothetical protein